MSTEKVEIFERLSALGTLKIDGIPVQGPGDLDACDVTEVEVVGVGAVLLVWGNAPGEAIADYTDCPEFEGL